MSKRVTTKSLKRLTIATELREEVIPAIRYAEALAKYLKVKPDWTYTGSRRVPRAFQDTPLRQSLRSKQPAEAALAVTQLLESQWQVKAIIPELDEKILTKPWEALAESLDPGTLVVTTFPGATGTWPWPLLDSGHLMTLFVPAEATFKPLKNLAYATDFEEIESRVPPWLEQLAFNLKLHISCLHISPKRSLIPWQQIPPRIHQTFRLELQPSNIFFYSLEDKDIPGGLLTFTDAYAPEWICLTYKRRTGISSLLKGQIIQALSRQIKVPVLCIPAGFPGDEPPKEE